MRLVDKVLGKSELPVAECEEIDVVFHVRTKNDAGQTVGVAASPAVKLLRANTPDVWAFVDAQLAKARETAQK